MNLEDEDEKIANEVTRSFGILAEALDWANEIVENVAESKRIKEVLDFVNARKDFLMQYTGNQIHSSLANMSASAKAMQNNLRDIKNLAQKVKNQAVTTKGMI